jgi:membrane-associated protein
MLSEITALILAYRYWVILPIAVIDAPLLSIFIGFLVATGHLNLFLAFGIIVLGDVISDTALYVFGRWCRPAFEKAGLHLNFSPARVRKVLEYFKRRDRRAIVFSKLARGVGFTGLIVAGSIRVPYRRFVVTCVIVTVGQSGVLIAVGMLSGQAYQSFALYLGYFDVVAAVVLVFALFVLYKMLINKIDDGDASGKPTGIERLDVN